MRVAYLDCFAGISGDMFLGALLQAGVPLPVLEEAAAALDLGASLRVETVDRSGISAVKVHVLEHGEPAERETPHSHAHGEHTHPHEHEHTHHEAAVHTHEHGHTHGHTHRHEPPPEAQEHSHAHTHRHEHAEEHGHEHGHLHPHEHAQGEEHGHSHPHGHGRSLTQIREIIQTSSLPEAVQRFAVKTFNLLGQAEAKIHNVPVDSIHFHEVGAVDAIVDIVAASAGISYLEKQEPVTWHASPVNVGGGMVVCAPGTFPVPAPAAADLLRGMPTYSAHIEKELVTPTGAALLRALAPAFGLQPAMSVEHIGYGAGSRNPKDFPNVLRLSLGTQTGAQTDINKKDHRSGESDRHHSETVSVLETALDDSTPQVLAHVAEQALAAGALDVMLAPVIMKKGRPGTLVTVLCNPEDASAMEDLLLRETSTLGVRTRREQRSCLQRRHTTVSTPYGDIRVKLGLRAGEEWNAHPEFEDCRAAALRHGIALKLVMQAAMAAHHLEPAL